MLWCIVLVIFILIGIICITYNRMFKSSPYKKAKGGYANIRPDMYGTCIYFSQWCVHKPIAIEYVDDTMTLNLVQLVQDINELTTRFASTGINFRAGIKDAAEHPLKYLNIKPPRTDSYSVYGMLAAKRGEYKTMFAHPLLTNRDGTCNTDRIIEVCGGNLEFLNHIRVRIISRFGMTRSENGPYNHYMVIKDGEGKDVPIRLSEMCAVCQGNTDTFVYYTSNGTPEYTHPCEYVLAGRSDPFKAQICNNDAFRKWYRNPSAMNSQLVRVLPNGRQMALYPSLFKDIKDNGEKTLTGIIDYIQNHTDNQVADIIPAGTVRQTVMLLLQIYIKINFITDAERINNVLQEIAYISLINGIANAFGNTTHQGNYNGAIDDNYYFSTNPTELQPVATPLVPPGAFMPTSE